MLVQQMRVVRKWAIGSGTLLLLASSAMCNFGIEHEIGKIPPEVRARMGDTDWVGAQWAIRALVVDIFALCIIVAGVLLWFFERRRLNEAHTTSVPVN
jgi:hypothetical protein